MASRADDDRIYRKLERHMFCDWSEEVGLIRDPDTLKRSTSRSVYASLRVLYFVPAIGIMYMYMYAYMYRDYAITLGY